MSKSFLYTGAYGAATLQAWADEMPTCPVCHTKHDASLQAPDSPAHVAHTCEMCGQQHRTVDFCPPASYDEPPPSRYQVVDGIVLRTTDTEKRLTEEEENGD